MRISELNGKDYLGAVGVGENSYVILNYKEADPVVEPSENENENEQGEAVEPTPPVTYKVTLDEIGRRLINDLNIVTYDTSDGKKLKTIKAGESAYSTTAVGEFINATDRTAIDSAITDLQYDTTNKKFVKKTYDDASFTDIVSTANILNDMNLNITQISNTAGKTVASITEADGKVGATFQDISILSSQISDRGTAGNVATLDENGHVPASQLPSYVDDVLEGTLATFPATGESGKIYVDTATNTSYRWSGSQYTKVASDLSLGETSSTAYRGDYGAAAYAHGVTNKGSAFTSNLYKITTNSEGHVTAATAVTSTDITNLFGKAIVLTDDSRLTDARNAADVSAWAKAATKPTYTASEVGALPDDTEIPDITGLAPLEEPVFTNSITIGETTLTEAQLQALLALLE